MTSWTTSDAHTQHTSRRRLLGMAGAGAAALAVGAGTATSASAASPAAAASSAPAASRSARDGSLIVRTRQGRLRGLRQDDGVRVWKGVRFAQPPTGKRRFAPPAPVEPWSGVREATEFGHPAMQVGMPGMPEVPGQSEDCLFLNVWSGPRDGRRPVVVWIHGGAFVAGTGGDKRFDGTHYVEQGCVLVTLNYRLAAFGCLYQPDRPGSGNLRLLDQIAALRWVCENIAAFGGDPANVTVMGESAGAMSIGPLLGAPAARGLFRRAVLQSGGARPVRTTEFAAQTTRHVLRTLGLHDTSQLMRVPAEDLRQAGAEARGDGALLEPFPHVVDGTVLPQHPLRTVDGGVDLLIGTCAKEADPFVSSATDKRRFEQSARDAAGERAWKRLRQAYAAHPLPGHDPDTDLLSGWFDVMPSVWLAERAHRSGARVWQYTFDYADAREQGAVHGSDVPFTFGNFDGVEPAPGADPAVARALSAKMVASFAAFARHGDPSVPQLPAWPRLSTGSSPCLSFDAEPRLAEGRLSAPRREAWEGVDPYRAC